MAINVSQAFHRTSANPIDESMALTKAQMLTVNDNLMPAYYLTICQDDGAIYLYDKSAEPNGTTGKFHKLEAGEDYVNNADLGQLVVDLYDSTKSNYAVDDYVIYQKKLYRCKTENTTNLPTNTTDWEKVNIIDTIDKKVNEHVPDLSDYVNNGDLGNLIVAVYTQKTYAVGDFCIYNKKFYQCSTAIGTAEVWTPVHWTEVTIMEVMNAEIGAIDLTPYLTEVDLGNVVATIWNKSTANTVGQYVIHDRKLYRCTSNTTAGADWDSSKWTVVKLTAIFQGSAPGLVPTATQQDSDKLLGGDGGWKDTEEVEFVELDLDSIITELDLGDVVASLYDSTATYNLNSYVIYEHALYRCTTAISQAENWTAAHWTKVSITGDFINEINLGGIVAALYDATSSYGVNSFVIHDKQLFRCNTAIASGGEAWNSSHWTAVLATQIFNGSNPGLVPSATSGDVGKLLSGDGTWRDPVEISYDSQEEEIHLDFSIQSAQSN